MKRGIYTAILLLAVAFFSFMYFNGKNIASGKTAPDFSTTLINNSEFSLSDLKGNYVLLDFWGSWCGPCLKEHPKLVETYSEFNDNSYTDASGFEVVSVALEKKPDRWQRTADRFGFNWDYQVVEISKFVLLSSIAQKYNVSEIPAKFLIGPNGDILLTNPSFSEIRQYLTARLD